MKKTITFLLLILTSAILFLFMRLIIKSNLYYSDIGKILFPMAKVGKFLDAGMGDSLYVYARAMTGGIVENEYPRG